MLTLNCQSQQLSSALSSACDFKSHFCKQFGPRSDCSLEQSDQGPQCLSVCKSRLEKFERIFSRRHKQITFSDAGFLGVLKVNPVYQNILGKYTYYDTHMYSNIMLKRVYFVALIDNKEMINLWVKCMTAPLKGSFQ